MQALYVCPDKDFAYLIIGIGERIVRDASKGAEPRCLPDFRDLPAIDRQPIEKCDIILQVLPCMLLQNANRAIAFSTIDGAPLRIRAQLLGVGREHENPYGYTFAARVLEIPNYESQLQRELTLRLPYALAGQFMPRLLPGSKSEKSPAGEAETTEEVEAAESANEAAADSAGKNSAAEADDAKEADFDPSERLIDIRVQRSNAMPAPIIYPQSIIRISLSLSEQTGGLTLGDYAPLINSRSHPNRVYTGSSPLAGHFHRDNNFHGDYFELDGLQIGLPATSDLATNFAEEYNTMLLTKSPQEIKAMRAQQQEHSLR